MAESVDGLAAARKPGQDRAAEIFRGWMAPDRNASQRGSGAFAVDDRRSSPNSGRASPVDQEAKRGYEARLASSSPATAQWSRDEGRLA